MVPGLLFQANLKSFDVNQSCASIPHGKLLMIKVQISARPLFFLFFILINTTQNAAELLHQHKNIVLLLATPFPYPLKDKDSLMPTDGFHHQSMECDMENSFVVVTTVFLC